MRAEALESYRALPLPDTTEEHWRFTDLKDFDPDSYGRGQTPAARDTAAGMLELDVAGIATITESGVQIERAPEGVTFEPLTEEHERLYSLVGWDEEFAADTAAAWPFASHPVEVGGEAELDWIAGGFGSKKGKVRIQNDLAGEGATSRVTGAYFTDGDQHLDYDTFQEHIAPNTTSDFAFKGAL